MRLLAPLLAACLALQSQPGRALRAAGLSPPKEAPAAPPVAEEADPGVERLQILLGAVHSWWEGLLGEPRGPQMDLSRSATLQTDDVEDLKDSGCTVEDGARFRTFFSDIGDRVLEYGEEILHLVTEASIERDAARLEKQAPLVGPAAKRPLRNEIMSASGRMLNQVFDLLPPHCGKPEAWVRSPYGQAVSCLHWAANISRPCARCVPRLVERLGLDCSRVCIGSVRDFSRQLLPVAHPLMWELVGLSLMNLSASDELLQSKMSVLGTESKRQLKTYLPCVRCVQHQTKSFGECTGSLTEEMEVIRTMLTSVEQGLKDGNLMDIMKVDVSESELKHELRHDWWHQE